MADDETVQAMRYTVCSECTTTELVLHRLPRGVVTVSVHDTTDPQRAAETPLVRLDAESLRSLGHLCTTWAEELHATAADAHHAAT